MKEFGLSPHRKRNQRPFKPKDVGQAPMAIPNLVFGITIDAPHDVWVSDFTYLPYTDRFIYLATVEDMFTRLVVGWALGTRHNDALTSQALMQAVAQYHPPKIAHSDQGSEYRSQHYLNLLQSLEIKPSMSEKASPWQNGHQESFYSEFKLELGHPTCYPSIGELTEAIARQIYYYNHDRIHTALKCPPAVYAQRINFQKSLICQSIEKGQLV
jgi:transposase InsO family protein